MKKLSLSTAVKSACVVATTALCSQAFAQPEIYGQVRLSVLKEDKKETKASVTTKTSGRADLSSGNSRIGIKGSEPLTENTDLEYRLEYKVDVAESTDKNFSARHGYLALNNKQYGKLLVGRTISYDDNLDVSPAWWRLKGAGAALGYGGSDWSSNTVMYTTPKFNNGRTDFTVQYAMDEGKNGREFRTFRDGQVVKGIPDGKDEKGQDKMKDGIYRDAVILGVNHKTDNGSFTFAYTRAGNDFNAFGGAMSVDVTDKATVGAMAHYVDYNSSKNEVGGHVALSYQVSEPVGFWVEGAYADNYQGVADQERTKFSVGTTYDFGKSTTTFASLGYNNVENGANKTKTQHHGVEAGIIYRF